MLKNIYIYLLLGFLYASDFIPDNNSTLNYTQVFFKWPQIENIEYYLVDIYNDIGENIQFDSPCNSILIEDLFDWDNEYIWTVCGIDNSDEPVFCHDSKTININSLPANYPNNVFILNHNHLEALQGITILDYESLNFSVGVNMNGHPIWYANRNNFHNNKILATQFLTNGNIVGFANGIGYEFNLNSEILFQTSNNLEIGVHHDIHKTSYDTYFLIDALTELHPCPNCSDELPDPILWQGDRFIELDTSGEILWEWDVFDYLSLEEYNPIWIENLFNLETFDWTHSNSIDFDEINNILYVSLRNLSRIISIDYTTKEIIWNLGNPEFINEPSFETDFGFSHQHSAQKINNDNLLLFDNGRDNDPELSRCLEFSFTNNEEPELVWEYILDDTLMSLSRGECDRLLNENTLISAGRTGNIIEVNGNNDIVWHLTADANNGQDINIYRSERIPSLYPLAFSFKLNDLKGSFINQDYYIELADSIEFTIYNQGWSNQEYSYVLLNEDGIELYSDLILIDSESFEYLIIDLSNLDIPNNQKYILSIIPEENPLKAQHLEFNIGNIMIGDINNDDIINILDAIELINLILSSGYHSIADINSDNILDILDIILLINIILNE